MSNQYVDPISKNKNPPPTLDRTSSQPSLPLHTIVKKLTDSTNIQQSLAIPNDIPSKIPNVKELGKVFENNSNNNNNNSNSNNSNNSNNNQKIEKQTSPIQTRLKRTQKQYFATEKIVNGNNQPKQITESFYINPKKDDNGKNDNSLDSNKKSVSDSSLNKNSITPPISLTSSTTSAQLTEVITPTTSPRSKFFTQGTVANLEKSGRKKNNLLIGHVRETPPSSPSSVSPTPTSPNLSSSPVNDDDDVKYLEKRYNSKKFQKNISARKSMLTKKDAEWIEKELTTNSPSSLGKSLINNNTLINTVSPNSTGNSSNQQPSSAKEYNRESVRPGYKRDEAILASSHDSDDIDIYESPCFRFIEEVGKKKSISAEPCRRPGIKTPIFLNVPTLAMPTQFHQQPPERLSSNTFSSSVEENSYSDSALFFNQQIINRVSHDKELSYLFFPILKQSTNINSYSPSPLANTINGNINNNNNNANSNNNILNNPNNNKVPIVGSNNSSNSSTSPQISGGGSSCDLYSLSPSPSTSPIDSSSGPTSTTSSNTNTNKESNRKSYFPMISLGKSSKNQSNTTPSSPSSITSSFSSSTSTPPLSPHSPSTLEQSFSTNNNTNTNNNNSEDNSLANNSLGSNASGSSPPNSITNNISKETQQVDIARIIGEEFKDRTDMIFCQFSNIRNRYKLKSSSLDGLIEILTHHKFSEPDFVDTFLLTYKTFTTPTVVLSKLIEKYEYDPSNDSNNTNNNKLKQDEENDEEDLDLEMKEKLKNSRTVKLRVVSILKTWIDKHYIDFEKNEEVLQDIISFIEGPLVEDGMEKVSENILRTLERKKEKGYIGGHYDEELMLKEKNIIHFKVPPPIIPQIVKSDQILSIHLFDDLEIARQLTLIEHESYSLIKTRECTHLAFSKVGKEDNSPNIVNIIKRSNLIPLWVATEVVQEERLTKRSNIIKKFISIADHCRNLNNFNAVMEILSGLNLTPVYRLKKTWETLPRKYLATFKHLNSLMAPKNNFKVYREVLHSKNPPCLPFLGLYLTDLTFIEEATPDIIDNGLINMVKRSHQASVIKEIQQFQQLPYSFTPVPVIRDFLLQINGLQERALYKQSKIIEP